MHRIMIALLMLIHSEVFLCVRKREQSFNSVRSISYKYSSQRFPRELNTSNLQDILELTRLPENVPNPCNNGGSLLHDVRRNTYFCQCPNEYRGRNCEIRTKICLELDNVCNFYEDDSIKSECHAVQGSGFVCYYHPIQYRESWCTTQHMEIEKAVCPKDWSCLDHILGRNQGYRCLPPGQILPAKLRGKREVNILEKCSCRNGGHCNEKRTCVCLPHFTGRYCESQINYCRSNPCPVNIECISMLGGYSCNCPEFRGGRKCEETRRSGTTVLTNPHFYYNANQYVLVPSTYLFHAAELGVLPRLIMDFGDGTIVTMLKEDFYYTDKLNDVLISFLYQPVDDRDAVHLVNFTHTYTAEGIYNISVAVLNEEYEVMKNNFTAVVSLIENCEFSVELTNAASTPANATIYQRRHSINIYSLSTVTCPGTHLKYSWELFAVPNIFMAAHPHEMMRRTIPDVATRISEYHVPPYFLAFGNYVLRLTVEMLEPNLRGNQSAMTWFRVVKDKIVAHISGGIRNTQRFEPHQRTQYAAYLISNLNNIGNVRQVHKTESFEIDASESYDPNFPSSTMRFRWICSVADINDAVPGFCDNERGIISNESVLYVVPNILRLMGSYTFTVTVESIEHDKSEQIIRVQAVSTDTELVQIDCVQNCIGNKMITSSPMALRAVPLNYNDIMDYTWTLSYNNGSLRSSEMDPGYYSDGNNFVMKPDALLPSEKYQISVRIKNESNRTKQIGTAAMGFLTYSALTVGFCILFPSQGYAVLTIFRIKCFNFATHHMPLMYEVFQYRLPKEEPIMIGFGVSPEFANITLVAGLPENDYSTALRVYASDSKGNFGFYEEDITVFPAAVYSNLNDELAIVKKFTLGTASPIGTDLVNQEVQSVIQTILSASCSVHTLSQQLKDVTRFRRTPDALIQDKINVIAQFKDTMVEYLALCKLRSTIMAKYCSSTLTSILECDDNEALRNRRSIPYANSRAVDVLHNIIELLHETRQQSEDPIVIRTDVLDIGTTILSSVSLLLKKPKVNLLTSLNSRRLSNPDNHKNFWTFEISPDLAHQEKRLATQTEAVLDSLNNYASLFSRYMAPHEDDYLTNPTEDICISVQKTNRGVKIATVPAYANVNVSILSSNSKAMFDLQVITLKNNPYWWEKHAENINFPLIKIDVFNTVRESRSGVTRVGAYRRFKISNSSNRVTYEADLAFVTSLESNVGNTQVIQGAVTLKPTWRYKDSDIAIHKLIIQAGGKIILVFDNKEDEVLLRVAVKKDVHPDLSDFWEPFVIPRFEENNLTERQRRSIYLEPGNATEELLLYYVGILPHQVTIRSLLRDIDAPVLDSFLYKNPPPKPKRMNASNYIPYSFKVYNAQCLRWNNLEREWTDHCAVLENDLTENTMSCHCKGLSTIGASFRAAKVVEKSFSLSEFIKVIDNSLIFWLLIYLTICFLGLFAWGGMWDRRDKKQDRLIILDDNKEGDKYCYVIVVQTGRNLDPSTSSRVAIMLEGSEGNTPVHVLHSSKRRVMLTGSKDYFLLRTPRSLGDVFCLHMWHNNPDSKPVWYIETIITHDVQTHTISVFIVETWLTPLDQDGHMGLSCYRMLNNELFSWTTSLKNAICSTINAGCHSWLGICARQLPRHNTRRRRVVLAYTHACLLMAFVTAFYPMPKYSGAAKPLDMKDFVFAWEEVIIGIFASCMACLVNCILFHSAANIAPAQSYTTDYSSRYKEELVIPVPDSTEIAAPEVPKRISDAEKMELTELYRPGKLQVIGKRTLPLRLPQSLNQRIFYDEVISKMGPIHATQRVRLAYGLSHTFLYPLWIILGAILLMALYFILFYATFYSWSTGLRYLFATCVGFLFSFVILEPTKVAVFTLWKMCMKKRILVIDDRSRIAIYLTHNPDPIESSNNRTADIYKTPTVRNITFGNRMKNPNEKKFIQRLGVEMQQFIDFDNTEYSSREFCPGLNELGIKNDNLLIKRCKHVVNTDNPIMYVIQRAIVN